MSEEMGKVEGLEPVWECEGVLRIGPWMASYDPSGQVFWDHIHEDVWCAVEQDGPGTKCSCGKDVPDGLVTMANLQKLNPKATTG